RSLAAPATPRLVITASRARSLGMHADAPVSIELDASTDAAAILSLVTEAKTRRDIDAEPAVAGAVAAIDLVKLAQVLPAVLIARADAAHAILFDPPLVTVEAGAVARFRAQATQTLAIACEAPVPLASGVRTRFVVFRDAIGDSPVAVIVGTPDMSKPVPV